MEKIELPIELQNTRKFGNTPDKICLSSSADEKLKTNENVFTWGSTNSLPFTYLTFNGADQLFIGNYGEKHIQLKTSKIREYFNDHLGEQAWATYYALISQSSRNTEKEANIDGRVWVNIRLASTPNKIFTIFAFWDTDNEKISMLTEMVAKQLNLLNTDIYIANLTEPYILFHAGSPINTEIQDNSQEHAIHLMNQKDKRSATADFRNTRDRLLGQKLTMSNGKEMPMAQYRALKYPYVDENIVDKSKKIYFTESQMNYIKENKDKLLNESSRDNQLLPYLEILNSRGNNVSLGEFKNYLMKKFVTEANIHALSLGSNFYLVGVARYYLNGDLTSNKHLNIYYPQVTDRFIPEICQRLDEIIVYLRNAYIDTKGKQFEQPEDFGTLSIAQLFKKYGGKVDKLKNRGIKQADSKPKFEMSPNIGKNYTFDVMYSREDCKQYNQATAPGAWCITYAEHHYNYYTRHNSSHFVIFRRNGYENIPRQVGPNFPLDEYGLSLLAVQQSNSDGHFICCTTRWNHGGYGGAPSIPNADDALDYEQLKKITGVSDEQFADIFKVWKENKPKRNSIDRSELNAKKLEVTRKFKYIEMLFRNGMTLQEMYNNKLIHGGKVLYPAGKSFSEVKPGKSVFMLRISESITDNDGVENINSYETIMDRGEVKVDEVLIKNGEIYTPTHSNRWSSFSREDIPENSCAICEINDKKVMFYDYRTHSIVEIGGVKYFSDIAELTEGASYRLHGCGSNQEMIYNFSTGQAVTIDGKSVFEKVKPQGGYSNPGLRRIVECVYDSAAKDIYFYDVLENKLLNKLTELARTNRSVEIGESAGNYLIVNVDNYNGDGSFERKSVLYNPDTDKMLYIDGASSFNSVRKLTDEWVNVNDKIINTRTFEALKYPNGEDVRCKYASHFTNRGIYSYLDLHGRSYNLLEIFLGKGENGKDKYVFYDLNTNSFYKNENGGFVFDYYGHCEVYTKNGNIVTIPDRANGEYWYQKEKFDNASVQKLLDEGMKPEEIFDVIDETSAQGINSVRLNNLYNFLNTTNNKLLSQDEWFEEAGDFHCGYASVKRIGEHASYWQDENYISEDGTFLLDDNVGEARPFNDYKKTAVVYTYRYWVINTNGEKIHPGYFNRIDEDSIRDRYLCYNVLETRQQRKWRYLSLKGRVYNNYLDAIEDSESDSPSVLEMERERQQNHNAESYGLNESKNFDAAARTHYSITGEKLGHYCHVVDDVINEMGNNFNIPIRTLTRESLEELCSDAELNDVMQSFNVQQRLNEKIWDDDNHLNPRVRLKLLEIADKFYKTMETNWVKPVDVIFTGSLCNYNWSKYSDVDLHVVVDFDEVDERTNFVKDYFDAKKKMWNEAHEDLKIYGFPVELYVQDENEEHTASGIYSLYKDNWIVEPSADTFSGENIDKNFIANKVMSCAEKIDDLEKQYNEENDSHKIEIIANKVKTLFDKIKGVRKESLKKEGEMSNGNIWFKSLRRLGYIEKLIELKAKTFDKINSIP